jgi:glycosyltransferase involved in cell wall biosynthesis
MKVLMVHNHYLIRGGEDESTEAEMRILGESGCEVDYYEEDNERIKDTALLRVAAETTWSQASYRKIRRQLQARPYDVVHVQNFFPLISPSVHYAARAEGIPTIQSLHNYRLLCPQATFFRAGKVCEDCLGKSVPWPGVMHACYRQSRPATGALAAMLGVHRALGTWSRLVDVYIAPTEFARDKFIEGGLPAERIVVKPNFVHPDPGLGRGDGGYALFVGRLSPEKGIGTLLATWQTLADRLPLRIVGEGPMSSEVAKAVDRSPNVEWLGRRSLPEVYELMGDAAFLVFPSEWYETFGRVTIEAFARGTPVIASDIGAIAELITPGQTGYLFRPGDVGDLVAKVEEAMANPATSSRMRKKARSVYKEKYSGERNFTMLMKIYQMAITEQRKRCAR